MKPVIAGVLLTLFVLFNTAVAQPTSSLSNEQIHRIGDYGKLWSVLKLFNPEMAYNKINEDSLFTSNISDLLNDPSAANFKSAVRGMLTMLGDPYTSIIEKNSTDSIPLPDRPFLKWVDDSIAVLYFDMNSMMKNVIDQGSLSGFMDSLHAARGIIIDLRKPVPNKTEDDRYYESEFMNTLIGVLADGPVIYPSMRTRIHYGHESETFNSSFYYQGWLSANGAAINGGKGLHKPVCFIVNRFNNTITDALAALQSKHIATIVADDSLGNFEPASFYQMQLADSLVVNVRLSEVIYPNGNKSFSPDRQLYRKQGETEESLVHAAIMSLHSENQTKATGADQLQNSFVSAKTAGYDSLAYPPASLRLLGLMRYWSTINYFCPNKDLIQKNWDSVLYEYVPKLFYAKDSLEYLHTVARLITEIHDGHGFFGSERLEHLREKMPALQLRYIEDKTVVYRVLDDSLKSKISAGDEIIAVNDVPVKTLRDSIAQFISASNNAALQRDVTRWVLAGKENTSVKISFQHQGNRTELVLKRDKNWREMRGAPNESPVWKKLDNKTGYVDFGRLEVPQIDSMFKDLQNTDAIILDDRSYPRGTVWTLISYLTDKTVTSANGTTMVASTPDPALTTVQYELWQIPVSPQSIRYKGKIIVLVNETTQSQAEYSCMVLQAAYKNVTIIGSQTAGADGDVTGILLPGGINTAFSGHGVHYPDGRPTQGIGIVPDIKVSPTVNGIKEGRDEVLERAIEYAKNGK